MTKVKLIHVYGYFFLDLVRCLDSKTMDMHEKEDGLSCVICEEILTSKNDLKDHLKLHISPDCDVCTMIEKYSALDSFTAHLESHSVTKRYQCEICNRLFISSISLKNHRKFHVSTEENTSIQDTTRTLVARLDTVQQREDYPYICPSCCKGFKKASELKQHMIKHGQKKHTCDICDKKFYYYCELKKHFSVHSDQTPYKCDLCNKSFARQAYLNAHWLSHDGNRPGNRSTKESEKPVCEFCGKTYSCLQSLKKHILTHTGEKPYQCKYCDKKYIDSSFLARHITGHTGERKYKCEMCNKEFRQSMQLRRHCMYIHTGEKPYKCTVCDKQFTEKPNLKRHFIKHTGEKPYSCERCDKKYSDRTGLKYHIRVAHAEKNSESQVCEDDKSP